MRPQKVSDQKLTECLLEVLRAKGYDGSSLNELALAGGLKKASLYHRFPGGKEALVQSVLNSYSAYLEQNVFEVLSNKKTKPKKRLKKALGNVEILYNEGASNCLYRALSMESGLELFGEHIATNCKRWIKAFSKIGRELGFKNKKAKWLALDGLLKIQGSLVLAKVFNDRQPFQDVIEEIRIGYLD